MIVSIGANIWARRRQQSAALASAVKKRDMPLIELTPDEWEILRRADKMAREIRKAEAGTK